MNREQLTILHARLIVILISVVAVIVTSGLVMAQDSKIGFVNIPKIMEDSPQAKAAQKRLQDEFSDTRNELDACSEGLNRLDKKLRSEGKNMDQDRRERMIETITRKRRECSEIQSELQTKFNKKRNEELKEIQELIGQVVKRIGDTKKLDLIVGPPILYKNEQIDLTEIVLKELEKDQ